MCALRTIEEELFTVRFLINCSIPVFSGILETGAFSGCADLNTCPDGNCRSDNVDCERVNVVRVGNEETLDD